MPVDKYYIWAMDRVGNINDCKMFVSPKIVAIGTDGSTVDLLLWDFTANGNTYSVNAYKGDIVDGKIVGSVPATINGKPVTTMSNTFRGCTGLTQAPVIPSSVNDMSYTFSGCTGLAETL